MKKLLSIIGLLLSAALPAAAQYTPITATVRAPNGPFYVFGTGSANIACPGNQAPTYNGFTLQRSITITGLDGFGTFSMNVYDVNLIQPLGCAWTFSITDQTGVYSFRTGNIGGSAQIPVITGNSLIDLSTQISSFAVPLPTGGGGTGGVSVNGAPVTNPNFQTSSSTSYSVSGSNIQIIASPFSVNGSQIPGGNFQNSATVTFSVVGANVTATAIGNVNLIPLNNFWLGTLNTFNGISATSIVDSGLTPGTSPICPNGAGGGFTTIGCTGGGGAGNPASPGGAVQFANAAASAFGTLAGGPGGLTLGVDSFPAPTTLINPFSESIGGPNPWSDATQFGMRAVSTVPTTTATVAGTTAVTLASASTFQNRDGIVIYGAGPQATVATPTITSVTPSLAKVGMNTGHVVAGLTGSTGYSYSMAAIDRAGGLSACSATVTTTTGAATLGAVTTSISTMTRSNNVVTVNTSGPSGAVTGAQVYIQNSSDATFSGTFVVASTPTTSQFTFIQGIDTRAGNGVSTSATGGTVTIYNVNHLVLPTTTGFQYYIWTNNANPRPSIPGAVYFDDFGQAAPAIPSYVPSTCPGSATNDYLATTIVSGGGTANIVVANAATQTASGLKAVKDDGPALLAAFTAATGSAKATVHIPASPNGTGYVINSHIVLPNVAATIIQSSKITINETIETGTDLHWTGDLGGSALCTPQFAWSPGACISVGTAYPGISAQAAEIVFDNLALSGGANSLLMTVGIGGTFNSTFSYDSFAISGTDLVGGGLYLIGNANNIIDHTLFSVNDGPPYGYSLAPMLASLADPTGAQGAGNLQCDFCFFIGRGYLSDNVIQISSGQSFVFNFPYAQALRTPLIQMGALSSPFVHVRNFTNDTSTTAVIANIGSNGMLGTIDDGQDVAAENSGGRPGQVTGNPIPGLTISNGQSSIGQNMSVVRTRPNATGCLPTLSTTGSACSSAPFDFLYLDLPTRVGPDWTLYWPLPAPTMAATSVAPTSGGFVPVGVQSYAVTAWGLDGGTTAQAAIPETCTTTSGNQTCTPSWTTQTGVAFWSLYRGGQGVVACNHLPATTLSCTDTSSTAGGGAAPSVTGTGSTTLSASQIITPSIIDTTLTTGTSPICPNGTNGAFTTSGCSGGSGSPGIIFLNSSTAHNAQQNNGASITSGGSAVTCTNCTFVSGDVGKAITLGEFGVGPGSAGAVLVSTISAFTDSHHVTIAGTAGTTNLTGNNILWGTADSTAINAAITSLAATGGTLYVGCGDSYLDAQVSAAINVNIIGLGPIANTGSPNSDCVGWWPAGNTAVSLLLGNTSVQQFGNTVIENIGFTDFFSQTNAVGIEITGASGTVLRGNMVRGYNGTGATSILTTYSGTPTQASNINLDHDYWYDLTVGVDSSKVNVDGPRMNGGEFNTKNSNTNFTGQPIGMKASAALMDGTTHFIVNQNAGATQNSIGYQCVNSGTGGYVAGKFEGQSAGIGIGVDCAASSSRTNGNIECEKLAACLQFESGTGNNYFTIADSSSNNTQLVNDLNTTSSSNHVHTQSFDVGPHTTVGALPSTSLTPDKAIVLVTNGASSSDCSSGGGSFDVLCGLFGGTWSPLIPSTATVAWSGVLGSSTNVNTGFVWSPSATGTVPFTLNCPGSMTVNCFTINLNGPNTFFIDDAGSTVFGNSKTKIAGNNGLMSEYNSNITAGDGISAILYQTAATAQAAPIGVTSMFAGAAATKPYHVTFYVAQVNAGTSCTGAGSVGVNVIYTDNDTGNTYTYVVPGQVSGGTSLVTSIPLTNTTPAVANVGSFKFSFNAKLSTSISYSTTYTAGSGTCSPSQAYSVYPTLWQD
jgi:hypothetical protein